MALFHFSLQTMNKELWKLISLTQECEWLLTKELHGSLGNVNVKIFPFTSGEIDDKLLTKNFTQ